MKRVVKVRIADTKTRVSVKLKNRKLINWLKQKQKTIKFHEKKRRLLIPRIRIVKPAARIKIAIQRGMMKQPIHKAFVFFINNKNISIWGLLRQFRFFFGESAKQKIEKKNRNIDLLNFYWLRTSKRSHSIKAYKLIIIHKEQSWLKYRIVAPRAFKNRSYNTLWKCTNFFNLVPSFQTPNCQKIISTALKISTVTTNGINQILWTENNKCWRIFIFERYISSTCNEVIFVTIYSEFQKFGFIWVFPGSYTFWHSTIPLANLWWWWWWGRGGGSSQEIWKDKMKLNVCFCFCWCGCCSLPHCSPCLSQSMSKLWIHFHSLNLQGYNFHQRLKISNNKLENDVVKFVHVIHHLLWTLELEDLKRDFNTLSSLKRRTNKEKKEREKENTNCSNTSITWSIN